MKSQEVIFTKFSYTNFKYRQEISPSMAKYTIDHDRPTCIGCAACEAIAPEFW